MQIMNGRAILTPKFFVINNINRKIVAIIFEDEHIFLLGDIIEAGDDQGRRSNNGN